ncbi:MAG: transposase [Candidatus Omnitrophota bacterium]|nr:transposase [Candidatus Omnitrophota bacterium]
MNRGRRREQIFFDEKDRVLFVDILGDCTRLFNLEIHAYSLMPNHYHLLVRTPIANLSRAMRHLNGVYTQKINYRHKYEGSLFKGRFKSIVIEEESYFLELLRYIHRNPLKAKIVEKIIEHKWTSHRAYMIKKERPEWLKVNTALIKFSQHENAAKRKLDAFVREKVPVEIERILDGIKWPAILGGKQFQEKIKEKIKGEKIDIREVPQHKEICSRLTAKDVAEVLVREQKKWDENVFSGRKKRIYTGKRRAFVYVCREYLYAVNRDICEALGDISSAAVSILYTQAVEKVKKKEDLYEEVKGIVDLLKLNFKT